jgi:hypothetical protein
MDDVAVALEELETESALEHEGSGRLRATDCLRRVLS